MPNWDFGEGGGVVLTPVKGINITQLSKTKLNFGRFYPKMDLNHK